MWPGEWRERGRSRIKHLRFYAEHQRLAPVAVVDAHVGDRQVYPVSFRQLASFSGIVRGNRAAMESILTRTGTPSPQAEFTERLTKAENWLKKWAPEEDVRLVDAPRADYAASLTPERREWIAKLAAWIDATEITLENATERLYAALPAVHLLADKPAVTLQDLAGLPHITFPNVGRPNFVDRVIALYSARGLDIAVSQEVGDAITGIALVARGFGVTLPRHAPSFPRRQAAAAEV